MEGQKDTSVMETKAQDTVPLTLPKVIQVNTYSSQAVNKVLVQQMLEVIGQVTKSNIQRSPAQMVLIQPLVLEFYWQITQLLFDLEADEHCTTGIITVHPELRQLITQVWEDVWKMIEFCQRPRDD